MKPQQHSAFLLLVVAALALCLTGDARWLVGRLLVLGLLAAWLAGTRVIALLMLVAGWCLVEGGGFFFQGLATPLPLPLVAESQLGMWCMGGGLMLMMGLFPFHFLMPQKPSLAQDSLYAVLPFAAGTALVHLFPGQPEWQLVGGVSALLALLWSFMAADARQQSCYLWASIAGAAMWMAGDAALAPLVPLMLGVGMLAAICLLQLGRGALVALFLIGAWPGSPLFFIVEAARQVTADSPGLWGMVILWHSGMLLSSLMLGQRLWHAPRSQPLMQTLALTVTALCVGLGYVLHPPLMAVSWMEAVQRFAIAAMLALAFSERYVLADPRALLVKLARAMAAYLGWLQEGAARFIQRCGTPVGALSIRCLRAGWEEEGVLARPRSLGTSLLLLIGVIGGWVFLALIR